MIFADGLISVWAFYAGIMVFGIYIYESLVMDVSFDIDDGQEQAEAWPSQMVQNIENTYIKDLYKI